MKNRAEILIEKLMNYFGTLTITELAEKLNMSQPAISQWKSKNYVKAISLKCKELGIYNEIFDEADNSQAGAENSMKEKTDTTLKFSDEITAVLHTASTVINESNKDSFVKMIKDWIIKNI